MLTVELFYPQVHGEVTNSEIDIFDREKVFIETILTPLVQKFPHLKIVMEHITTMDAVKFVLSCPEGSCNIWIFFFFFLHSFGSLKELVSFIVIDLIGNFF